MSNSGIRWRQALAAGLVLVAACGDSTSTPTTAAPIASTTSVVAPTTAPPTTVVTTTTTTLPAQELVVAAERIELAGEGDRYTIAADLPRITGLADAGVQARVNDRIRQEVQGKVDFYREAFEDTDYFEDLPASEMGLGSEATLVNDRVLSLRFDEYWYFSGAAHPDDDRWTLLFNLETGDEYSLPELLSADSAPLALLTLVEQRLVDDYYEGDIEGLRAWIDLTEQLEFGFWALTPTTFDVSYGKYTVGPGVLGSVTVSIPYDELGALINPEGPIADLVG
jgi:hypothetical protein